MSPTRAIILTPQEAARLGLAAVPPAKYGNTSLVLDGHRFASQAEARRYGELHYRVQAGEITDLVLHPRWPLIVNGVLIGHYTADFAYQEAGALVVEDVKGGPPARDFILRKKLMLALYGIAVQEIRRP